MQFRDLIWGEEETAEENRTLGIIREETQKQGHNFGFIIVVVRGL